MIAGIVIAQLWQSLLLAACIGGLLRLRSNWSAELRYWVWSAALLAIAMLPLFALLPRPEWAVSVDSPAAIAPIGASEVIDSANAVSATAPLRGRSEAGPVLRRMESAVTVCWFVLMAWRFMSLIFAAKALHHWRRNARLIPLDGLPVTAAERRNCPILQSAEVASPLAAGVFRPFVLLPEGLLSRLERPQLRLVLLHELAHIHRGDVQFGFLQRLIETVYFYSPVVHWVSRQVARDREASCDDRVIGLAGEATHEYAECLIRVARIASDRAVPALAVGALTGSSQLGRRIERLIERTVPNAPFSLRAAGITVVATFCAAVLLSFAAPEVRSEQPAAVSALRINVAIPSEGTPLIVAARAGNLSLVNRLLAEGADVNLAAPEDGNPLIVAAAGGYLDIVKTLIAHGARVNEFVPDDETPLINAARGGHLEVLEYLIGKGADVNLAVTANGTELRSPLSEARKYARTRVIEALLKHGARH